VADLTQLPGFGGFQFSICEDEGDYGGGKTWKQDVEVEEQKLCLSETKREGVLLTKDDSAVLPAIKWMAAVYVLPRDRKKSTTSAGGEF